MNIKVIRTYLIILSVLATLMLGIMIGKPLVERYSDAHRYDFFLDTSDGPISKGKFHGKVLALYFGYMYCPDVCPTSLSALADAMAQLSTQEQQQIAGLFVSVDPKRDTLDKLKEYALYFHDNFIGATSPSVDYLHRIVRNYGGSFRYMPLKGSDMEYSVNHTSDIYLFDEEGNYVTKIPHLTKQIDMVKALKKALSHSGS